jgi:ADP-dependent NAD(P)H-hydrate dehydratase / NAD(P)H-hydrate epimerase
MKVVTADQIRELDRRAMTEFGLPGAVLMENAGRAVVDVMARVYGPLQGKRVVVCCGTGNNGGDGFVVARYLHLTGAQPVLLLVGSADKLKSDARVHYDVLHKLPGIPAALDASVVMREGDGGWQQMLHHDFLGAVTEFELTHADVIVDALLGTGIQDAPRGQIAEAISAINRAGRPVISVDVPSGLNSDTGETPGETVRASHTVTFAYPKLGLFLYPGAECVGRLHVADIGFDWDGIEMATGYRLFAFPERAAAGPQVEGGAQTPARLGLNTAARLLQRRSPNANKGDYGHVAVVAGSAGMVGAPAMLARAAQRSGAGLVTVLAAAAAQPGIAAKLDEQMTLSLPDADGAVSEAAYDQIAEFAEKATVLCIGPGLTTRPGATALVQRILAELHRPIVLDADGLNALALRPDCLQSRPSDPRAPLILTPHPGEAARLLGTSIRDVESDRIGAVRELARRYRAVALLKGRYTLIAGPSGDIVINTTGNPGMATGGSGDVLTGVIGGLLARGLAPGKRSDNEKKFIEATVSPDDAVSLGVYIHGLAGDLAKAEIGETGLVAGDIVAHLPHALRQLLPCP